MRPEQKRVKQLLTEAITLLCRNSLQFKEDVTVEGLLGITLDKSDIFLVSIHETVQQTLREGAAEVRAEKRSVDNNEDGHTPKKRRRRRGSREGSSSPPLSPSVEADQETDHPVTETSDRVNIKEEKTSDENGQQTSQDWPEDGRKFNPAHDSTSEPPTPDSKALIQKQQDFSPAVTSTPGRSVDTGDTGQVQVKQEVQEEEEEDCFLIDSDSQDASDTSRSLPPDGSSLGAQSWASPGGDQSGFNLSELDMISAANFQQQFGNLAMGGGANNMGNMTWDPSQLQSPGQPSTSGTQEGSRMPMPVFLLNSEDPVERKKELARERARRYRQRVKEDKDKYVIHKKKDNIRKKRYVKNMSEETKVKVREQARERARRYRHRLRESHYLMHPAMGESFQSSD